MLTFIFAALLLLSTPGPGVLSTAGVGAAFGYQSGLRYLLGLFLGNNLVALMVVSGLAAIIFSVPMVRNILLGLSVLYLLYLAFRIATAGADIAFIKARSKPGISSGLFLQIINPKCYAVHTAMFSGFALYPASLLVEILIKFAIINIIWIPVHLLWLQAGAIMQRLNLRPTIQRRINILMAIALVLVVVLALYSVNGLVEST